MATSLYDLTVPVFLRGFAMMSKVLEKGRAFADDQGIAHDDLLQARLIDDMHPLPAQVQRASDAAKLFAVRVGKVDNVPMADDEASFDDLQARIARTVAFLEAVPADAIDGREGDEVTLTLPTRTLSFTGIEYAQRFAVPNFYFHATMTYALLRMKGVPVGKIDFLGGS